MVVSTDAEVRKASAVGARELKDPTSVEYAYQTVAWLKTCYESERISYERYLKALAEVEQDHIYERVPVGKPYGSMAALVRAELGVELEESKENKAKAVEYAEHEAEHEQPISGWGEVGKGRIRPDNVRSKGYGNAPSYI